MEVIVLGLLSALRPATSQAAVFALLRAPEAARTLLAFAAAGLTASMLVGVLGVGAFSGAGEAFGHTSVTAVFDLLAGAAALAFAARVRGRGLEHRSSRSPGRATAAIAGRLAHPTLKTAATAGVATHVPGVIYLVALNAIAGEDPGPAEALVQIALYNTLWFAIPLGALVLVLRSPATATAYVDSLTGWARSHEQRLIVGVSTALGLYLAGRGLLAITRSG